MPEFTSCSYFHITGYFLYKSEFYFKPGINKAKQLAEFNIFPGSPINPKFGFTYAFMDHLYDQIIKLGTPLKQYCKVWYENADIDYVEMEDVYQCLRQCWLYVSCILAMSIHFLSFYLQAFGM